MSIAEGQSLGNYRILRRIGVGGMGAVYLAEHPLIGKKVALKVIHKELAGNREVISRFFNEARAVNKIGNEHIVEIHDFGQSPEGEHFFIMEYLEGRTLADALTARPVLEVEQATHIGAQIAAGLAAAHSAGIIHRDLKPDNIMLVPRLGDPDFVKVLDFGLAKMFVDAGGAKLTAQGVVLGTPQYMSPEACESKQGIDHRSDIYSLGILLFQMLTGRVPFDGETMGEVLVKHVVHPPPAPRAFNPAVPPSVEQIVLRCLAKHPDSRFATMKDLREALLDPDRYLAGSPPVVASAPSVADAAARTMFGDPRGAAPGPERGASAPPGSGREFALKPPPPSAAAPLAAHAKTMFVDDGAAAPRPAGGGGQGGAAEARTAFMDAPATSQAPAMPGGGRRSAGVPALAPPAPAVNHTMMIGTPPGYSDRPPRKRWPVVVALLSVALVSGGGVALLVWPGLLLSGEGAAAAAAQPVAASDAAVADEDDGEGVEPALARIQLETVPDGAEVFDTEGKRLGRTPTAIALPRDGREHLLIFRHPDAVEREKSVVADADTTVSLELELLPPPDAGPPARVERPRRDRGERRRPRDRAPEVHPDDLLLRPNLDL